MEPADHHHLSAHNRSDDIDNTQAAPDNDEADEHDGARDYLRRYLDAARVYLGCAELDYHNVEAFVHDLVSARNNIDAAITSYKLAHQYDRFIATLNHFDGERQPEVDPGIGDDRGVVE